MDKIVHSCSSSSSSSPPRGRRLRDPEATGLARGICEGKFGACMVFRTVLWGERVFELLCSQRGFGALRGGGQFIWFVGELITSFKLYSVCELTESGP